MSDRFNKFQFSKSQKQLGLCCILIGIIGIISIICACTIGSGLNISKGKDPKDYYGTYYVVYDNIYGSFEFTQNKCNFTLSNGVTASDDSHSFDYEYVSAKYAQKVVESPLYKDRAAILVYTNEGKDNAIVLWVTANAPLSICHELQSCSRYDAKTRFCFSYGQSERLLFQLCFR